MFWVDFEHFIAIEERNTHFIPCYFGSSHTYFLVEGFYGCIKVMYICHVIIFVNYQYFVGFIFSLNIRFDSISDRNSWICCESVVVFFIFSPHRFVVVFTDA